MSVLSITWVFCIKLIDLEGQSVLYKARCCVRGDFQVEDVDYDQYETYASVASCKAVIVLFACASANNLMVEKEDVANAYFYGRTNCPVYIEQPTDLTGQEDFPGNVCLLLRSMCGIKQAGQICESLLVETLIQWRFQKSNTVLHLLFLLAGTNFVLLVIVLDDLFIMSNSLLMLASFNNRCRKHLT